MLIMIKTVFFNLLCIVVSILLSYLLSVHVGALYCAATGQCAAAYPSVGFTPYVGFLLSYLFLIPFSLSTFGSSGKYWWLGIFVAPVFLWPLYLGVSFDNLISLVAVASIGFILGTIAHKALQKLAPAFMAKIH